MNRGELVIGTLGASNFASEREGVDGAFVTVVGVEAVSSIAGEAVCSTVTGITASWTGLALSSSQERVKSVSALSAVVGTAL